MPLIHSSQETWDHCVRLLRPALLLAPHCYLADVRNRLAVEGIDGAVRRRDAAIIFDWIVRLLARQGVGNHAAEVFLQRRGSPTFAQVSVLMAEDARCPRLRSHWHFAECRFRRSTGTCGTPHHQVACPVTVIPARKGALAEATVGLWLFLRDCCDGDLVGWIDARLAAADAGDRDLHRVETMCAAVLDPLIEIPGTGRKVWSMILAELLLGGDPDREKWIATGESFIAIDSLVHAFLHRAGILRRLDAKHAYGPACYAPGGCADVIAGLAARTDAREFNAEFPAFFPRYIQFALWTFCAADGWSICNSNKIDDHVGCQQISCPAYSSCDRLNFQPDEAASSRKGRDRKPEGKATMTCQKKMLRATHRNARALVESTLDWRGSLCSNNHNRQFLMYYEAFRQTAYTMISDGGPDLAIELMEKVIEEMREAKKARRAREFDESDFRRAQDRKIKVEEWDIFMDIPFTGEVPSEDDDTEGVAEDSQTGDGWIELSPFVHYKPLARAAKKIGAKRKA